MRGATKTRESEFEILTRVDWRIHVDSYGTHEEVVVYDLRYTCSLHYSNHLYKSLPTLRHLQTLSHPIQSKAKPHVDGQSAGDKHGHSINSRGSSALLFSSLLLIDCSQLCHYTLTLNTGVIQTASWSPLLPLLLLDAVTVTSRGSL